MNNIDVSVVIPVYNNSESIRPLYEQVDLELTKIGLSHEIIFVDDASRDQSINVLWEIQKETTNTKVVSNLFNQGQQKSILIGLQNACGNYCLVMDADLQDSPGYIKDLVRALNSPFEAVFLIRQGQYESIIRLLSSLVFKSIAKLLSGLHQKAGTFFIIKSELVPRLVQLSGKYIYVTYMIACLIPDRIQYVYGVRRKRESQRSSYTYKLRFKAGCTAIASIVECKYKIAFQPWLRR